MGLLGIFGASHPVVPSQVRNYGEDGDDVM